MGHYKRLYQVKLNSGQESQSKLFAERYQLLKTIGEGGMGQVCLAKDTLLDNYQLALKVLHPELSKDEEHVKSFFKEAQLNRKINHPNVVRIFDVGQAEEVVYYTMEYVEGTSLKEKIARGPLATEECIRLLKEVCAGLAAIHDTGIIHRDLKPGNVMIEAGGVAKIADFGIAKTVASDITENKELVGCAHYMAPELWKGKEASVQTDIYALGIILFEMLTGKVPYSEGISTDLLRQHICAPIPEVKNDATPSYLKRLCYKLLSKNDFERPKNCYEIIQKLSQGTSTSITHDDFVRPTVMGGLETRAIIDQQKNKLPDYTTLKRKTNPDSYKIPVTEVRAELRKTSLASFAGTYVPQGTVGSYSVHPDQPIGLQIFYSFVFIITVGLFAHNYMIPWDSLLMSSGGLVTGVSFIGNLALCIVGLSILFSIPAAIVAALRPGYMREKRFFVMWGELCCLLVAICISLFVWQLFQSSDDLIRTLTENPSSLYNNFKKSAEMLIYVALFVPKFVLQDLSLVYYLCLACYAIGAFAIFQTSLPGRNSIFTICMILLPLILFVEYSLPIHARDSFYNLTVQTVTIPIGSHKFELSKFALYCGIFNWCVIFFLVTFLRRIVTLARRQ